jgi:hypothetical protein
MSSDGFFGLAILACQLFEGLLSEDIFLKQASLPVVYLVLPDKLDTATVT